MELKYVVEQPGDCLVDFCVCESWREYLTPCIYCGMPSGSVDHIPPRSMRAQLLAMDLAPAKEIEVPACQECNSALGSRPLMTITARRMYIKDWLRRRNRKLLRIPNWTKEDLEELGDDLRKMIQRNMILRDLIKERIAWRG